MNEFNYRFFEQYVLFYYNTKPPPEQVFLLFIYKILLSIYAQIYNSSPTYRGRRILAIYYVKEENPTYEELKEWYSKSGLPLKKFFNTSGMLYKEMGLKDKLKDMSEDEQLKLLATDGMLVKRPLVIGDDFVLTGFREKEWSEAMHM